MFGAFRLRKPKNLEDELSGTDAKLALLNAELAAQMVKLAGQTEDLGPLAQAEEALSATRRYYEYENTPIEICLVQSALGDMFMRLGKSKNEKSAFHNAHKAYRTAMTLASMQGDENMRIELRDKLKIVDSLLGKNNKTPTLFKVA